MIRTPINKNWLPLVKKGGYHALSYALHNNPQGVANYINSHYPNFPWQGVTGNGNVAVDDLYRSIRAYAIKTHRTYGFVDEILANTPHNDAAPGAYNIYKQPNQP